MVNFVSQTLQKCSFKNNYFNSPLLEVSCREYWVLVAAVESLCSTVELRLAAALRSTDVLRTEPSA